MLYGVLLVEKKGILPSKDPRLINAIDEDYLRKIDLYALSNADPNTTDNSNHGRWSCFTPAVKTLVMF